MMQDHNKCFPTPVFGICFLLAWMIKQNHGGTTLPKYVHTLTNLILLCTPKMFSMLCEKANAVFLQVMFEFCQLMFNTESVTNFPKSPYGCQRLLMVSKWLYSDQSL